MAGAFPHVPNGNVLPKMNRRTFITASSAVAIGFGANSILTIVLALVLIGGGRFSLDAR